MEQADFLACEGCDFFRDGKGQPATKPGDGNPYQGFCFRRPPAAQLAGGQHPMTGERHMTTVAYRPPVWSHEGCGDGRARGPIFSSAGASAGSRGLDGRVGRAS